MQKEVMSLRLQSLVNEYKEAEKKGELKDASEQTVRDWLNKLFDVFGWNTRNTNQVLQEKSLSREEKCKLSKIGSSNTRPDYTFVNGDVRLFFVDAKDRKVRISSDASVAFQVCSYGWSIGAPYSIVTNFEELAIYDCTSMPKIEQTASTSRLYYFNASEYFDNFDTLNQYLGREYINQYGLLNDRASGGETIDIKFAEVLGKIRLDLAKSIMTNNVPTPSIIDLNLWVQVILNRVLFIRVCEARGLEEYGLLKKFCSLEGGFWENFKNSSYCDFYNHYDGPLFDRIDSIHNLIVDDEVFLELVNHLYYPSPYCFDVIPLKSISDIYDLFLGYRLEYNASNEICNVLKSEFRKSNGAVTTPIELVEQTLRSTFSNKPFSELSSQELLQITILDPACGSGIFLVAAFEFIEELLITQLSKECTDCLANSEAPLISNGLNGYALGLDARKSIIANCLYGIDINQECVEVCKLSLSLKIIDGYDASDLELAGLHGSKILEGVGDNIKCGNTLVDESILNFDPTLLSHAEEFEATNIFNWKEEFSAVYNQGGFDYVIGNPPYVEVKHYNQELATMARFIKSNYESCANGKVDLAIPFIEKGLEFLNDNGSLGYLIQKRFFKTDYGKKIREMISSQKLLREVYDYQETNLFHGRITYVAVIVCDKAHTTISDVKYGTSISESSSHIPKRTLSSLPWILDPPKNSLFFSKCETLGTFQDVCSIKVGLQALWVKAYHILVTREDEIYIYGKTGVEESVKIEKAACRKLLCNDDFSAFAPQSFKTYILFPYRINNENVVSYIPFSDFIAQYPEAGAYLQRHRDLIESKVETYPKRFPGSDENEYWHLFTRIQNIIPITQKIAIAMTAKEPIASVIQDGGIYGDNANVNFAVLKNTEENINYSDDNDVSILYAIAAIINSTPFSFFAKAIANPQEGGFFKFNRQFLDPIPFPVEAVINRDDLLLELAIKAREIERYNLRITQHRSRGNRYSNVLSRSWNDIDNITCDLYQLTQEEKTFVLQELREDRSI